MSALQARCDTALSAHGKNRHGNLWDHFSIYLTIKDQHLREIEALLTRSPLRLGRRSICM